jgi:hypothetical protein
MRDMVDKWNTLGFIVEQSDEFIEVERCAAASITLLNPALNFRDVPQGPGGTSRKTALAVIFEILSPDDPVTIEYLSGPTHPRIERLTTGAQTIPATSPTESKKMLFKITYETGTVGENLTDTVSFRQPSTGRTWNVDIKANTVGSVKNAVALVLDRSGSMNEDRGDGFGKKIENLREAASIFVDVMLQNDGVGIVRYNRNAQPLISITQLGPAGDPLDPGRTNVKDIINGPQLNPSGATSIGDGILEGRTLLNAASGFDDEAVVILTDGKENSPAFIADVAASVNERTFAIGFGTPQNTNAAVLQTLTGNTGGYLLVTGDITGDNRFILTKYFLQILAGITNAEIILDPQGDLSPGVTHRIPFQITEAEIGIDVILLTPGQKLIDFYIETPTGQLIDPGKAEAHANITYVQSKGVRYYRITLPVELIQDRFDHEGRWHALISHQSSQPGNDDVSLSEEHEFPSHRQQSIPYNLLVHAYSNLRFSGFTQQKSFEPGATAILTASLTEYDLPIAAQTRVWAEITRPDNTTFEVDLAQTQPGHYTANYDTTMSGVYRLRIRAFGTTHRGWPFEREQTFTTAVWNGGDQQPIRPEVGEDGRPLSCRKRIKRKIHRFFKCLFGRK